MSRITTKFKEGKEVYFKDLSEREMFRFDNDLYVKLLSSAITSANALRIGDDWTWTSLSPNTLVFVVEEVSITAIIGQ